MIRNLTRPLVLTALTLSLACSGSGSGDAETIPFDAFVSAYVDLRISALRTTDSQILAEERTRIMGEHGLADADLLGFIDARGRDATYMQSVWDSVDVRLRRATDSLNSVAAELPR